jgi:putative redox protein
MREMQITLPGGKRVDAEFDGFIVKTDQGKLNGGDGSAPQPFDVFLASLGTCAGIYVKGFCDTRGINTDNISIQLRVLRGSDAIESIVLDIQLPADFPEKYKRSVCRAADLCAVKQLIQNPPKFEINAVTNK